MSTSCGRTRGPALLLVAAIALGAALGGAPSQALAAPTSAERSEAKAAWQKGRKEAARKRWSAATAAFRDADVLDPKVQYKLDLARALIAQDKLREASEVLDEIDASKEPTTASVRGAADDLRQKAEKRLATIVVEVKGPEDVEVAVDVDGEKVKAGDAVRLDPGTHLVRARAEGWVPVEQTIELREGQTEAVTFPLERDPSAPGPDSPPSDAGEEDDGEESAGESSGGTLLPAAIAWGVGGVAIGLGAVFGVLAFDEAEKARVGCVDNVCPEENVPALDASRNNGTASTICFVVGGVGIATGVVLAVLFAGGDDPPAAQTAGVRPWIGGSEIGVEGRF